MINGWWWLEYIFRNFRWRRYHGLDAFLQWAWNKIDWALFDLIQWVADFLGR